MKLLNTTILFQKELPWVSTGTWTLTFLINFVRASIQSWEISRTARFLLASKGIYFDLQRSRTVNSHNSHTKRCPYLNISPANYSMPLHYERDVLLKMCPYHEIKQMWDFGLLTSLPVHGTHTSYKKSTGSDRIKSLRLLSIWIKSGFWNVANKENSST
jgi:hypothetical protein